MTPCGATKRHDEPRMAHTAWQDNVHRGPNGELQGAPTAKIGLLANAALRVEPYATPYAILPHA